MTVYTITVPPTANKLWKPVNYMLVKTAAYRKWMNAAGWEVKLQRKGLPSIQGPVAVSISLRRPRANADLDNRIKPSIDALQAGGAIENDKQITSIYAAWADHDGCRVTISPDVS